MISKLQEQDLKSQKGIVIFQIHYSFNLPSTTIIMEARSRKPSSSTIGATKGMPIDQRKRERDRSEYRRSTSNANGKKGAIRSSYFSSESMVILVCLTASLLILPLILPPLPPPPFLLLLLPIAILGLLMILAFMPSNVRDLTCSYM